MKSYQQDKIFGIQQETFILPQLRTFFKNPNIKKTENEYDIYDFTDGIINYELKSRNNKYNQFPTTLLTCNKLSNNCIYVFNFKDGIYYIKYDEQLFNTFEKKQFVRNYRFGKDDKPQEHIFIPIQHLIKIN
jgi:hypothetical protein